MCAVTITASSMRRSTPPVSPTTEGGPRSGRIRVSTSKYSRTRPCRLSSRGCRSPERTVPGAAALLNDVYFSIAKFGDGRSGWRHKVAAKAARKHIRYDETKERERHAERGRGC